MNKKDEVALDAIIEEYICNNFIECKENSIRSNVSDILLTKSQDECYNLMKQHISMKIKQCKEESMT